MASYTDDKTYALIMLPVADSNLAQYLKESVESVNKRSIIPEFFVCLSKALWFFHGERLRHRDIKPENILVFQNKVLLTDFDCSYSWAHTNHSTTTQPPPRTLKWASPEVARSGYEFNGINSSSDVWSLGCVFLAMATVLKGL
jgi:serine/threonine protein kinase